MTIPNTPEFDTTVANLIRLEEAFEAAKEDRKVGYEIAANKGYTATELRKAIKIHRMPADKRAKFDSAQMDLELYLSELEGRAREAEQ